MLSVSVANKFINYTYVSVDEVYKWQSIGFKEDSNFALDSWDEIGEFVVDGNSCG